MKPKIPSVRSVAFVLFVSSIPAMQAADRTWNGGGGDNNWSTDLNWGGTAPVGDDFLFFGGSTRLTPSNNILADTTFAGITFNADAGAFTLSNNRLTLGGNITNNSANQQTINNNLIIDSTRSITPGAGGTRLGGVISGNGGLKNIAAGSLTLLGTSSNNYTGLTSVEAGRLILSKTSGATAVAGNLSITGGGVVSFANTGGQNQIADTASVTINGSGSTFNGTGANAGNIAVNETIASLTVNDGYFNSGSGAWIITGAGIFDGTNGDVRFIGNSGANTSFGSLSLIGMTGTTIVTSVDGFVVGGNSTTKSSLNVGSGGLSLNGSRLVLNRGTGTNAGSRLVLDGNVSVTGNSLSTIQVGADTNGSRDLELSSTAGTHSRAFDVAGTSELLISTFITNGAATNGSIVKTGTGLLRLNGTNTYTGTTTVSQGTLLAENTASLPGFDTAGRYSVASGATLAVTTTFSDANIAAMLGTGNFAAGSALGFDVASGTRTYVPIIADTANGALGVTKSGAGLLHLTGANTYTGLTTISQGTFQLGNNSTPSTGSIDFSSAIVVAEGALLRTSYASGSTLTISQAISGPGAVSANGQGTTVLSGATSNTYTGLTTANGGILRLAKTGGATAISGNLNITGGGVTYAAGGIQNQIADTSIVTIGSGFTLNGTGVNAGAIAGITETIGSLGVNGGIFNTGNGGNFTVTGAATFNGGVFVGNSGTGSGLATTTFGSLSLTGMTGTTAILESDSFGIGGNSLTTVVVGSGGLSLNNSSVRFSTTTAGSRIILNGNVSTTGSNATGIGVFNNLTSNAKVELSSTTGTHNRTFDIGADAPMTISVAVNKGSATTAGIIKQGSGVLSLEAANDYNGSTVVTGGTLRVAGAINSSTSLSVSNSRLELGAANVLNDMAAMSLTNATFATAGFSDTLGVLTISGNNTLDLGSIASVLRFANSSSATWASTLSVLNWTGDVLGGGTDQVFFGTNASGLTPSQLSSISFLNPEGFGAGTYAASFLANGEIVPIPEPSAFLLSGIGVCALLLRRKRCA